MPLGTEKTAVQNPLIDYAVAAGWTYLPPEDVLRLRRGDSGPVLHEILVRQLQRLNPGVVDLHLAEDVVARLVRVRPSIEGNLDAWEFLKGLKTVFVEAERRERNVRLLDPVNPEANTFHVTDEFRFTNGVNTAIRADVVFLVNGIPVIVVETKAATQLEGIAEALDQLRRYHRQRPELLALAPAPRPDPPVQFFYGATWSLGRKGLFNWRDEQAGDFETLVKTFVAPRRVLRVLTDFILFTRKDDELQKVVLRPHQMRAVERVVQRAADPTKRRGLVWHTQGSGKTYTMITVAQQLHRGPRVREPDRADAGRPQRAGGASSSATWKRSASARSRSPRQAPPASSSCQSDRRGLIVSMIHKFDDIPADVNTRENVFVLVDEAHRTDRRRPRQLPDGGAAQRHLHRLHRHAHRPDRPRQGHLQGLRRRRPEGLPRQVLDPRVGRRTAPRSRCTTRWPRTTCGWTARCSSASSSTWPSSRASATSRS